MKVCLQIDTEGNTAYHRIVVAVYHDGATTSEVNILLPPVTHLHSWGGGRRVIVKLEHSLANLRYKKKKKKKIHNPGLT